MSDRKKVAILNFDLSDNSLGRAYILAQALSSNYDVMIVGPIRKGEIWEPLRRSDITMVQLPYKKFPSLLCDIPSICRKIDGDIVYAVKPRFTSFGFGLLKKLFSKTPLILDIDDWEIGFYLRKGFFSRLLKYLNIINPNGLFWTRIMQLCIPLADRRTTVSTFLKKKFGGIIIPHAKDMSLFDPVRFRDDDLQQQLGLLGKRIVMFLGTPRKHKGIEDALSAVFRLDDPETVMMVVGANLEGAYEKTLRQQGGKRIVMIGRIPYEEVPRYLMLADVVVIPQRESPDTTGQIPSKLFDAMAMARPIVSTKVADIPMILDGCGVIVNPGDIDALSGALKWVFDHPEEAAQMGQRARNKCGALYSLQEVNARLEELLRELGC